MVKRREPAETMTVSEEDIMSGQDNRLVEAADEDDSTYEDLYCCAQEIRKNPDVLGYILRGESKATVDLNESSKIIEYAMMSSQAIESYETIAEAFNLGESKNIVIEGRELRILILNLGKNKLSVFMNKDASYDWLFETLSPRHEQPA